MNKVMKQRIHRRLSKFTLYRMLVGGYRYYQYSEERRTLPARFRYFGANARLEENVEIAAPERCHIGVNAAVGKGSVIRAIGGFYLGDHSVLAAECMVLTTEHRYIGAKQLPYDKVRQVKPVHIGDYVWIGVRVLIHSGVRIGDGAIVGMGSVVTRDVPSLSIVAGNPAVVIGKRPQQSFEELRAKSRGRNAFTQCPILWVPPFTQRKHEDTLEEFGFVLESGEEYFLYDKYRGTLDRISNAKATEMAADHD